MGGASSAIGVQRVFAPYRKLTIGGKNMADQDGRTLAGVFPVMATPFDEDGALDVAGLGRLVAFELDAGAHGLTILGNMGEVFKLSEDERATVTAGVIDAVAGRAPVVV